MASESPVLVQCRICLLPDTVPGADLAKESIRAFCPTNGAEHDAIQRGHEVNLKESVWDQGPQGALVSRSGRNESVYLLCRVSVPKVSQCHDLIIGKERSLTRVTAPAGLLSGKLEYGHQHIPDLAGHPRGAETGQPVFPSPPADQQPITGRPPFRKHL
jgi:hypothetical protein